jgi:acetylornithine deacetylase/succinyl-diaminopimelate desuccinylase-like protein
MIDWETLGAEATRYLSQLVQIDTTNPPGNERQAAEFVQEVLVADGIDSEILESLPGRANLVARIQGGDGSQPPLLLLNHLDVVYADPSAWTYPPFSGAVADGYVWGRGALDMKGLATMELMAMLLVRRLGLRLNRDLIYLAVADEETLGVLGAQWMIDYHWDKVKAGYVLNEGGQGIALGNRVLYLCATGEKGYSDLRLRATGRGGHASMPRDDNPVVTIANAIARIAAYEAPTGQSGAMKAFLAKAHQVFGVKSYDDVAQLARRGQIPPFIPYSARNIFSPTIVMGGQKENVIPTTCQANVNCRPLPGIDQSQLVREAESVIKDTNVAVEVKQFHPGTESSHQTDLFATIESVLTGDPPGAVVLPYLLAATTDSRLFRSKGVIAYGITPVVTALDEFQTVHSTNERLSVENLTRGTRLLFEILARFCGANYA